MKPGTFMLRRLIFLFILGAGAAFSSEVVVVVSEITFERIPGVAPAKRLATKRNDTAFTVDIPAHRASPSDGAHGARLAPAAGHALIDRRLPLGDGQSRAAEEILAQCRVDGTDLVIARHSYNSVNPLYWFAAVSGHPVQFSEIFVATFAGPDPTTATLVTLLNQSRASHWEGAVFAAPTR